MTEQQVKLAMAELNNMIEGAESVNAEDIMVTRLTDDKWRCDNNSTVYSVGSIVWYNDDHSSAFYSSMDDAASYRDELNAKGAKAYIEQHLYCDGFASAPVRIWEN